MSKYNTDYLNDKCSMNTLLQSPRTVGPVFLHIFLQLETMTELLQELVFLARTDYTPETIIEEAQREKRKLKLKNE